MKKLILLTIMAVFINGIAKASCPTDTIKPANPYVYLGSITTLTDANSGGTWSSSNALVASIGTTGIVTPLLAGTTTITYAFGSGCHSYLTLSVNPLPYGPTVVLQKGTATYVLINGSNYKRSTIGTSYVYNPNAGDSTVSFYNVFNNRIIVPPTIDTNFVYYDSSNNRAYNMLGLRTWLNANLE